jgi:tryptophan synthase beta chain
MVKVSYFQKPYRRSLIETWGASVVPSPSPDTNAGRAILAEDPESTGSLGIAISEAVEDCVQREDTKYSLGSVLNHVLLHQTIVGEEALKQMEMAGDYPDIVIGCVGGGSNYAGAALPFVRERLTKGKKTRFIATEPEACPTMTRGPDMYDFGDTSGMTPLVKMFTLGHTFVPPAIHAGGLRYHGMAPIICELQRLGIVEARAYHQNSVFEAAVQFARTEGIVPAPEPAHAIRAVIDEALACKQSGESKVILLALSGHGHFDMGAYDKYFAHELEDFAFPEEKMKEALTHLPQV